MQCPACQHTDSRVLESRSTESGQSIRRRRECLSCQHRFTTYERVEAIPTTVIKRDGRREPFERDKLLGGMARACTKTGVTRERLEALLEAIETQLQKRSGPEVTSRELGELVLSHLRPESEVAYIRFASVCRGFQNIEDFFATLSNLQADPDATQRGKAPRGSSGRDAWDHPSSLLAP
ncbi:MAG: transcriptional regulator NrdR [Cyanobacteria bacterium QS_8_64_29]|nr:MAG: transcriptional regulator NrdR [Cyanobacteria bacterium QS_8_64_29]